ncbi:MAG: hypothetical protein H6821_16485 [Planctomycetaceae bacterium]|nr:hypothetical protein [Planctomycetales bacterium]MCB9875769.1 hypothetical protein [Planctomycetaceae bacterium]MCB9939315.1 hypothetical protein [Planctomycetaceae bacterium]HRX81565.1 hypothetical protein [Pirellulaceae bacterium]
MEDSFCFDDLAAHEIDWLLRADEADLPEHYSRARQNFLWRIGGPENAQLAIQFLNQIEVFA